MKKLEYISYEEDALLDKAQDLAAELNLILNKKAQFCLLVTREGLSIKMPSCAPVFADFTTARWQQRKSAGKTQGLVRACKPIPGLKIIDATAGWGRDAAILASFGAEIVMIERHPIMAFVLHDALQRRSRADQQSMVLSLCYGEAKSHLMSLVQEEYPDVIYIDPMHPTRNKTALVKKEMQILQSMIGSDEDVLALILLAINCIKQRVVVKWPQKLPPLLNPDACIEGKTVRFDLYFPKAK